MGGLRRRDTGRFHNENERRQRTARDVQLPFILQNKDDLLRVVGGQKKLNAAINMDAEKEDLTPNQLDFINGIYERTWDGVAKRKDDEELGGFKRQSYKTRKKIV